LRRFSISRADQDAFALRSQQKAAAAQKAGKLDEEIVAVKATCYENGKHVDVEFKRDELVRADTTLEGLASLKPAFAKDGSVTAGNASPLSDGAAMAIVMSKAKADALGVKPPRVVPRLRDGGRRPGHHGHRAHPGGAQAAGQDGLSLRDIDLIELNEAFASQAVYVQRTLEIPDEKLNVHGGAIALGHPLGCTGAKLTATALYELRRRGGRYAIVTMCIGGGMGAAGLLEAAR